MAGPERARWRQVGAWWEGGPAFEGVRWADAAGRVRETVRELPPICEPSKPPTRRDRAGAERQGRPTRRIVEPPASPRAARASDAAYVPLHVLSGYSFGRSVLLAEEIPRLAAAAGSPAVAIADEFSLAGAFEAARQARKVGVKPIIGASFEVPEGGSLVLLAKDATGWRSLSRLVTECHLGEQRLFPLAAWERLERNGAGLLCLTGGDLGPLDRLVVRRRYAEAERLLDRLIGIYGRAEVVVEIDRAWLPWGMQVERELKELAGRKGLVCAAGGAATHRRRSHFPAQDVLACFRTLCRVDEVVGRKPLRGDDQPHPEVPPYRSFNAERFFKTADEMRELYADAPELLAATRTLADRVDAHVLPGRTELPHISDDPHEELRQVVEAGARRWHRKVTPELKARLSMELERIARLGYSAHFLLSWKLCGWARSEQILFSCRGSAVDSAVMYCLGISRVDAFRHDLHFDRFLPDEGTSKPDIDIDFEAKRRPDVHRYLLDTYGKEHVAGIAAFSTFRTRGVLREVGKALGIDDEMIGYVAKRLHGGIAIDALLEALDKRPELRKLQASRERLHWVFQLAAVLRDVPRAMSMHSSGVIITKEPVRDTIPVQSCAGGQGGVLDRIVQFDKRSVKHCAIKFDILCLRGQDVLSGTQSRVREADPDFEVDEVDPEQDEIFRAMRSSQTVGIPQSASPAMTQAHARIATRSLEDASLVQAGIRPGVGGSVKLNQLIARRHGKESYAFDHPELERILGHTYGIVVFQEQIDQLLQVFGGLSSDAAEEIREKLHDRRRQDDADAIRSALIRRIAANGYAPRVAEQVVDYVAGFKGYGFAQGHALAFAQISARSVWCQQHHAAAYFAALMDAQPAGYYGPATLANEARSRGLVVLPPDVQISTHRFEVEDVVSEDDPKLRFPSGAIRVDLGSVAGLSRNLRERILAARPFASFADFVRRSAPARDELEQLILCGALDSLHANRRELLWGAEAALSYAGAASGDGLPMALPEPLLPELDDFRLEEKAILERTILGLDTARHLMAFERDRVAAKGGLPAAEARALADGAQALLVGHPIRLRFPPTPSGRQVVFFDLEDESGLMNVTCFDQVYRRFGDAIILSQYCSVIGRVQRRDGYPAFLAERIYPYVPAINRRVARETRLKVADFLMS